MNLKAEAGLPGDPGAVGRADGGLKLQQALWTLLLVAIFAGAVWAGLTLARGRLASSARSAAPSASSSLAVPTTVARSVPSAANGALPTTTDGAVPATAVPAGAARAVGADVAGASTRLAAPTIAARGVVPTSAVSSAQATPNAEQAASWYLYQQSHEGDYCSCAPAQGGSSSP